ncbi:hypothetical protein R3P38DRAFT_3465768 [Favolaschia claudopus]|uniref:Uncharacterized protein n=1 Tax=Favolaschia claudopus TaxID=2862362 RepID=A0AAV9ZEV4_9AGAR
MAPKKTNKKPGAAAATKKSKAPPAKASTAATSKAASKNATKQPKETAEVKALKAKLAAAEAALVTKRNTDLLDEEEEESSEAPARKKSKRRPLAPPSDDEEEPELFGADDGDGLDLGPSRVPPPKDPNADDGPAASPHDKDDNAGNSDAEQDEEDGEEEEEEEEEEDNADDMVVEDAPKKKGKSTRKKPRRSDSSTTSAGRITLGDFSPQSLRLANTGRYAVRVAVSTQAGFPEDERDWTWEIVTKAIESSGNEELIDRFALATEGSDRRDNLVSYVERTTSSQKGEITWGNRICLSPTLFNTIVSEPYARSPPSARSSSRLLSAHAQRRFGSNSALGWPNSWPKSRKSTEGKTGPSNLFYSSKGCHFCKIKTFG